ncbi:hypothetical protein G6F65_022357 [Rhizopus arrhizus]|nr:hypothetical protein G6F65_022357 [Rhizopus arrhizus]
MRTPLDGGPGRYRATYSDSPHMVSASWRLRDDEYSIFMAFFRNYRRSGGAPLEVKLRLDSQEVERYVANVIPGSMRLVSKAGRFYTVSASLEVQPKFQDPDNDYWAMLLAWMAFYGGLPGVRRMLNQLEKLVNEDWPNA